MAARWGSIVPATAPARPSRVSSTPWCGHTWSPSCKPTERTDGAGLPRFVEDEFRLFLTCGIHEHGVARLRCDGCGLDRLLLFSCKGRGFCPSCECRRMTERAAHAVDAVFPHVAGASVGAHPAALAPLRARVGPMDSVGPCSRSTLGPCLASSASGRIISAAAGSGSLTVIQRFGLGVESERPLSYARALRRVHRPVIVTCAPPRASGRSSPTRESSTGSRTAGSTCCPSSARCGISEAAMRRVARLGDGWMPNLTPTRAAGTASRRCAGMRGNTAGTRCGSASRRRSPSSTGRPASSTRQQTRGA
jgi:hypothetical protein